MESQNHSQHLSVPQPHKTRPSKVGRWSPAERQLFDTLIERYGTNWKQIHARLKGRTLSQIRSHAQKFFEKIGQDKRQLFEKKAKLLEAYEILASEEKTKASSNIQELHYSLRAKGQNIPDKEQFVKEEEHFFTGEQESHSGDEILSEKLSEIKQEESMEEKLEVNREPVQQTSVQFERATGAGTRCEWSCPFPFNIHSRSFLEGLLEANACQLLTSSSLLSFVDNKMFGQ